MQQGGTFCLCCTWFSVPSRNVTSEISRRSPQNQASCGWTGSPLSGAISNGIEIRSRNGADADHRAARRCAARARWCPPGNLPEDASWAVLPSSRTATVAVNLQSSRGIGRIQNRQAARFSVKKDPLELDCHRPRRTRDRCRIFPAGPSSTTAQPSAYFASRPSTSITSDLATNRVHSTGAMRHSLTGIPTPSAGRSPPIPFTNRFPSSSPFAMAWPPGHFWTTRGEPVSNSTRSTATATPSARRTARWTTTSSMGRIPKHVVEAWAWLVGTTPLPPLWSLGYQQSRYSYYPEAEVRRIAARLRSERIPADVIWLDIDYQFKNRPFTVDPERFPHFRPDDQGPKSGALAYRGDHRSAHCRPARTSATSPTTKVRPATTLSRILTVQRMWAWSGRASRSSPTSRRRHRANGGARSTRTSSQRAWPGSGTT